MYVYIFLIKIIKKATVEQAVVMVLHVFSFRMTYLQTTAVLACHCHRRVVATTFVLVSLTPDEWHTFLSFCRRDVWNEWWWHRFPCQWLLALLLIHFFLIWHNLACSFCLLLLFFSCLLTWLLNINHSHHAMPPPPPPIHYKFESENA